MGDQATCSPDAAMAVHANAAAKYNYICSKIRADVPSLKDIYLMNHEVDFANECIGIDVLFANFNALASTNFVAHPSLDIIQNSLIFNYRMDKAHSFSVRLDQSRINIVLAIFICASRLMQKDITQHSKSTPIWLLYIRAWIKSIVPGDSFLDRAIFVDAWTTSEYDLVWFFGGDKDRIAKIMKKLADGIAPMKYDPLKFLQLCAERKITEEDFNSHGPSMAMHYVLVEEKKAVAVRKMIREKMRRAQEAETEERRVQANALRAARKAFDKALNVDFSDDEEDDLEDGEKMDVDEQQPHFYEGFDLITAPWDAPWMKDLLAVKISTASDDGPRIKSNRMNCIEPDGAMAILLNEDTLT